MNTEGSIPPHPRSGSMPCRPVPVSARLRRFMTGIFMALLSLTDALAHARIQHQVDPETGITTYSFRPESNDRREKPAPPPARRVAPEVAPLQTTVSATRPLETRTAPAIRLIPASYRDFPRISAETQKERDSERRRILKQELAWEEEKLTQAIEDKAAVEVVQRYRANIDALHREIRNVQ